MNALKILSENSFKSHSDLNYCTENGIEYYIGSKGINAAVVAIITDENNYFINKDDLREMSCTAKEKGIENVILFTNYGIELHSKFETPSTVGFGKIHKMVSEF